MKNWIQTFEPNELGRDFVVGDLHGSLSCLEKLKEGLYFCEDKDRMFSVGDLVDRGPDSLGCLELLKESWFKPVLANHEQMLDEAFEKGGEHGQIWLQNGGWWAYTAYLEYQELKRSKMFAHLANELDKPTEPHISPDSQRLFDMLPKIHDLPLVITIKMKDDRKFHIIHAELPPGHLITDDTLSSPGKVEELANIWCRDGSIFMWGRFMFGQLFNMNFQNFSKIQRIIAYRYRTSFGMFNDKLSHIISGHTIMQHPITVLGQTNIDTGAYNSYAAHPAKHQRLTCVQLDTWKFYQATPDSFRQVLPITVNKADILKLRPEFAANPGVQP